MSIAEKIMALMGGLKPSDVQAMPPAHRERFAQLCKACAILAELPPKPKAGVLGSLKDGRQS